MEIVACRQCGHQVARHADRCPQCGVYRPGRRRGRALLAAGIIAIVLTIAAAAGGAFTSHASPAVRSLQVPSGRSGPGAPESFRSGQIQIVPDIHAEPDAPDGHLRRFRSILSIPVRAGGPNGTTLAVLNVDGSVPNLFDEDAVEQTIMPLVAPSVNLIALVLLMRREDARYGFHS